MNMTLKSFRALIFKALRSLFPVVIGVQFIGMFSTHGAEEYQFTSSDLIHEYFIENGESYEGPHSSYYPALYDPNRYVEMFLQEFGPMDHQFGVIGSASNLGLSGLFGNHPMNPQTVFRMLKNWEEFAEKMTELGGPGSENGPVSKILTKKNLLEMAKWMPAMNYVDSPLAELGVNFIHGVLGATGPNGDMGVWGYNALNNGSFLQSDGTVVRETKSVLIDGKNEKMRLFEVYKDDRAHKLSQVPGYHDSSFGVIGELDKGEVFHQSFTPRKSRWVSILLVKGYAFDQFRIKVLDKDGNEIPGMVAGQKGSLAPFIRLKIPKNRRVFIEVEYLGPRGQVRMLSPFHYFTDMMSLKMSDYYRKPFSEAYRMAQGHFRLFVTGAPTAAQVSGVNHGYLKSYQPKSTFKYQRAFDTQKRACEALFL